MKKLIAPKNEFGVDLVKIFAMFSVLSLHFFLYSGFYELESHGLQAIIHGMMRMLFYQCVPLFIMITGYLKRNAKFCAAHYIKLIPVLISSLAVGLVTICYKIFCLNQSFAPIIWLQSLWTFNQPGYGWYINLYISLFMITPFINGAYNSLKTKKQKTAAVIIFIFVSMFAVSINRIPLHGEYIQSIGFIPNYLSGLWPLGYYIVGMYVAEFRPKISKWRCALLLFILLLFEAVANYVTTSGNFYGGITFNNEDCVNVPIALLIFLMFYDIQIKNIPIRIAAAKISAVSVVFYLLSWIGDDYFYTKHRAEFKGFSNLTAMFFKIIPIHIILCLTASLILFALLKPLNKAITAPLFKLCSRSVAAENPAPVNPTPVSETESCSDASDVGYDAESKTDSDTQKDTVEV